MGGMISVVVPVFNSENTLYELHSRLVSSLMRMGRDYEIIMVDDCSRDGSYAKMRELHEIDPRVKAIKLSGNFGQQNALMCGFKFASGKYVVTMDDDLQHPPEEIEKILGKLGEGYDAVYGIPVEKKHSGVRNIGSKMTDFLFNKICNKPKDIRVSSFRVMTGNMVKKVISDTTSFVYISAILFKNNARIGNVPVRHDIRKEGESNYNYIKLARLFIKLYLYYSPSPFKKLMPSGPQYEIEDIKL